MDDVGILLAVSNPVLRAELRGSLAHVPGVRLVGEAGEPTQAAKLVRSRKPQVLFVDQLLLGHFSMPGFLAPGDTPHVVLVTLTDTTTGLPGIPLAGTLPFSASPRHIAATLEHILSNPMPIALDAQAAPLTPTSTRSGGVYSTTSGSTEPAPAPATPRGRNKRRMRTVQQLQLESDLLALQQQQRDSATGLVGPVALNEMFRLLLASQQAAAFVVVEIQDMQRAVLACPPLDEPLIRQLGETMRQHLRQEDMVCHAGSGTFVLLFPGLRRGTADEPVQRLRTALIDVCGMQVIGIGGRLAMAVAYWEAGLEPSAVLAQCQQAVRRTPFDGIYAAGDA